MKIREYKKEDYKTLLSWFKDWDWDTWEEDLIPKTSYIAEVENKPIAFSCFYKGEGTSFGHMGPTITDKNVDRTIANNCVDELLNNVFKKSLDNGIKYLHYATNGSGLFIIRKMQKLGAQVINEGKVYMCVKSFTGKNPRFVHDYE